MRAPLVATLFAGVVLFFTTSFAIGLFESPTPFPSVWTPIPAPLFICAFEGWPILGILACVTAFLAWNAPFFWLDDWTTEFEVPLRSWFLLAILIGASTIYYIAGWRYGVEYQGLDHCVKCAVVSAVYVALATLFLVAGMRTKNGLLCLIAHWWIFAWAYSYAFPYLGELP